MYFVCERARQDVKVALVGQGPDELFAGYTRHLGVQYGGYWRRLPGWLRRSLGCRHRVACRATRRSSAASTRSTSTTVCERYRNVFSLLPGDEVDGLFRDGLLPGGCRRPDHRVSGTTWSPRWKAPTSSAASRCWRSARRCPDELLMYADKISMAHGLEVRVPYLDKEVVEFAQRLPASFKVRLRPAQVAAPPGLRALPAQGDPCAQEARLRRQRRRRVVRRLDEQQAFQLPPGRRIADVRVPRAPARDPACSTTTVPAVATTTRCCSASWCSRSGCARMKASSRRQATPGRLPCASTALG